MSRKQQGESSTADGRWSGKKKEDFKIYLTKND